MNFRERIKKIRTDYLLFRDECVSQQIVAVKRISILAMLYSAIAPFVLYWLVTGSIRYLATQYGALTIVSVACLFLIFLSNHLKCFQEHPRRRTTFCEIIYFGTCFLYIAWGNLSLGITYRETGRFDIVVWIVIYLIVAAMSTMMPFQVLIINTLALIATLVQIHRMSGKVADRTIIYHVVMYTIFISYIMIEKYHYALKEKVKVKVAQSCLTFCDPMDGQSVSQFSR